ncbi:MAG: histidine kinase [Lachnospiraceae bacterium]|nr:histidine kinase [Lachnospiraceae bacterium]
MKKVYGNTTSIRKKLLRSYLLLVTVPTLLIAVFIYTSIIDLLVNDSISSAFALSKQGASALEALLGSVSTASSSIKGNSYIRRLCSGSLDDEQKEDLVRDNAFLNDLNEQLKANTRDTVISSIHIYTDQAPADLYDNWLIKDFFLPTSETNGVYWHGIMNSSSKTELYCPPFYLSHSEINNYGSIAYIEQLYPTTKIASTSPSYLAVYISSENINNILKQDVVDNEGVSYIINERQSIVASSDAALAGAYFMDYDTARSLSSAGEGYTTKNVMGQNVYATSYRLGNTDWYMVSVIPAKPVLSKGIKVIVTFSLIYILTFLIAFYLSFRVARSITDRLSTINEHMLSARMSLPVRIADPTEHDEIGELTDSYNYMAERLSIMSKRERETAEELRISEIRALQAQINPHFLYNTMDMISWLSQTEQSDKVTEAIRTLSDFYKLTLSKETMTNLESELSHVKLYINLQNMRYEGKIGLIEDIPDEMLSIPLPRLTLQPIVENSILHGILETEGKQGTIVITGWINGDDAIILISDDGVGMNEETLKNILSGKDQKTTGTNIAVFNTHRRLQMIYGRSYGLTYRSEIGNGTEVEIRIKRSL